MMIENKRSPANKDTDPITFGKHVGELLQDVPPHYLVWLWDSAGYRTYSRNIAEFEVMHPSIRQKIMLANYIWNSKDAINMEMGVEAI